MVKPNCFIKAASHHYKNAMIDTPTGIGISRISVLHVTMQNNQRSGFKLFLFMVFTFFTIGLAGCDDVMPSYCSVGTPFDPSVYLLSISMPDPNLKMNSGIGLLYHFQKSITTANGIIILGTALVSDNTMRETSDIFKNIVGALKNPADQAKFRGFQIYIITGLDPDISTQGGQPGQRNTGGNGFMLMDADMVKKTAVDPMYPNMQPAYRAWYTPIHEFGHAIEFTLGLVSKSDSVFTVNEGSNYNAKVAREYFAWATQQWFSSSDGGGSRNDMPTWEKNYFSSIFNTNNTWLPDVIRK